MIFERLEKYYNEYKQYEESIKCRALLERPLMIDYNDTKTILNEIERLNNIINELENWLNIQITCSSIQDYGVYKMCLNKLKELKEKGQ